MNDPEPVSRPGLFTNGDWEAWRAQVRFLRLVLKMPWETVSAIDFGILPEHPADWQDAAAFQADHYRLLCFKDEPDLQD